MAKNSKRHPNSLKNLKSFKPGKDWTGNAKGAKPGPRFKTVIRQFLEMERLLERDDADAHLLQVLEKQFGRTFTARELMTVRQVISAQRGDGSAFDRLADREEGKPTQPKFDETKGLSYTDFLDGLDDDGDED